MSEAREEPEVVSIRGVIPCASLKIKMRLKKKAFWQIVGKLLVLGMIIIPKFLFLY